MDFDIYLCILLLGHWVSGLFLRNIFVKMNNVKFGIGKLIFFQTNSYHDNYFFLYLPLIKMVVCVYIYI
jgi:hypothetical protein